MNKLVEVDPHYLLNADHEIEKKELTNEEKEEISNYNTFKIKRKIELRKLDIKHMRMSLLWLNNCIIYYNE